MRAGRIKMRSGVWMLVFLMLVASLSISLGSQVRAAGDPTVKDILDGVIDYYRNNKTTLDHWEELVALKNAGVDFQERRWDLPDWDGTDLVTDSPATAYAGYILGLMAIGQDPTNVWLGRNLVSELQAKQVLDDEDPDDGGFGGFINDTVWAIIALDAVNDNYDKGKATKYLLDEQKDDGGFAFFWGDTGEPDDTAMALIALSSHRGLPGVEAGITSALNFLNSIQLPSAGFASWGDENANSIATVISGLLAAGEDLTAEKWIKSGSTIIDALLNFQLEDGSFYASWMPGVTNDMATRQVLKALGDLVEAGHGNFRPAAQVATPTATPAAGAVESGTLVALNSATEGAQIYYTTDGTNPTTANIEYNSPIVINNAITIKAIAVKENMRDSRITTFAFTISGGGGSHPPSPGAITVSVTVIGKNRTYFSGNVTLPLNKANALEALKQTGLSYRTRYDNSYVYEIAGETEDLASTAGWKYMVNGYIPGGPAKYYSLSSGDTVIWFWADDYTSTGPGGQKKEEPLENPLLGLTVEKIKKLVFPERPSVDIGGKTNFPVEIAVLQVVVTGGENPMPDEEKRLLRQLLEGNRVDLKQWVEGDVESLVADDKNEIVLQIEAGALEKGADITIKEKSSLDNVVMAATHRLVSPVYQLGPSGTVFNKPVLLSIRLAIPDDMDPRGLVLAWFDKSKGQWFAIPALVDVSLGVISGFVDHFTDFAVLVRETPPRQFRDVDKVKYPWAADQINYLATRGILHGVGENIFEPAREATRAEFAAMLVKALNLKPGAAQETVFDDIDAGSWYAPYVHAAVKAGIVRGITEKTFKPMDKITREQMAVMVGRAVGETGTKGDLEYRDAGEISSWARDWVNLVSTRGLLEGFPDGSFQPKGLLSRAQSTVVIYKLLIN